jgi:hypothetical protein
MCVCRGRGATPGEKLAQKRGDGRRGVGTGRPGLARARRESICPVWYDRRALRRCASPLPRTVSDTGTHAQKGAAYVLSHSGSVGTHLSQASVLLAEEPD